MKEEITFEQQLNEAAQSFQLTNRTIQSKKTVFKEGAQWALSNANLSKWIDINERLPEPEVYVLAIDGRDGEAYIAYICGEIGGWWDNVSGSNNHITHWMPIPSI